MRRRTRILVGLGLVATVATVAVMGSNHSPTTPAKAERGSEDVATSPPAARHSEQPALEATDAPSTELSPTPVAPLQTYIQGQVLVSFRDGANAEEVARRTGARLLRPVGRSGLALMEVPEAGDRAAAIRQLLNDPDVEVGSPNAIIRGATPGNGSGHGKGGKNHQWHHAELQSTSMPSADFSDITVAILDSGVAYETRTSREGHFVQALGLAATPFAPGWDFVNNDAHPNDDHQHGTHITSIVAASSDYGGMAPGVTVMPVKVLDENNAGSEYGLVEGLYWAIDHGADVINLSLCFSDDYVPSPALQVVFSEAAAEGIVVLAAAGNTSLNKVAWPAAHPSVISVGAARLNEPGERKFSDYSSWGAALDIWAPGGSLLTDKDQDGVVDGIPAETFTQGHPDQLGVWMMEGSSQATAIATGAVVQLLAAGVAPEHIGLVLRQSATEKGRHDSRWDRERDSEVKHGEGSGHLEMRAAYDLRWNAVDSGPGEVYVGMLPWFEDRVDSRDDDRSDDDSSDDDHSSDQDNFLLTVKPHVHLQVVDGFGMPINKAIVVMTVESPDGIELWDCRTDRDGLCEVKGTDIEANGPVAVSVRVDTVLIDKTWTVRPRTAVWGGIGTELLMSGLETNRDLEGLPVAWYWPAGPVADMGNVAESYSLVDSGVGFATLPVGVVVSPGSITRLRNSRATVQGHHLNVQLGEFGGTGFATLPVGFRSRRFAFIDGVGLATLPIGISPRRFHVSGLSDDVLFLDDPTGMTSGSAIERFVEDGGWTAGGYGAATFALGASGGILAEDHVQSVSLGAEPL